MEREGTVTTHGRAPSFIIKRPRLTKLLDDSEARIILLVAPAGYGKTTLAREWLHGRKGATAWYSASAASSDVVTLAIGLAEELDSAMGDTEGTCGARLSRLTALQQRPDVLARVLSNSHAAWPKDIAIVVDDYHHLVVSEPAESFIGSLVRLLPSTFLIATRSPPTWIEARRTVYGEAMAIGISDLRMTDEETRQILLQSPRRSATASVSRLADGWPAVIGLAARARRDDLPEALPSELYKFLADELLASASEQTQRLLGLLAVSGISSEDLAGQLLGTQTPVCLEEAERLGLISLDGDAIAMHPLLAEFLVTHVRTRSAEYLTTLRGLTERLLEQRRWNECLEIGEAVPEIDVPLIKILESALDDFLGSGRLATLRRWIDLARANNVDAPVVDLAAGEIALRAGDYDEALAWGRRVAESSTPSSLAANACLLAARAAHFNGRRAEATAWFERAESEASTREQRSAALHGQFLVCWENQAPDARQVLQRLAEQTDQSVAHQLRVAQGRFLFALSQRSVDAALEASKGAQQLLMLPADPLVRSAAMNLHAWGLLYAGRYGEALTAAERVIAEIEEFGINFVVGHAELAKANALIGLRRFAFATRVLAQMTSRLEVEPDSWISGNIALAQAYLQVSLGDLTRAADELLLDPDRYQTSALWSEFHAMRALIAAARKSSRDAERWLTLSEELSDSIEPYAICSMTRAILATHAGNPADARRHFERVASTGYRHSIVIACRACPPMAQLLAADEGHRNILRTMFSESADAALAKLSGIRTPRVRRFSPDLSDRELEVYELLVQGRTNRQIAEALFIAESTTKVHVRHIFEKLGVRSRVEAVRAWTGASRD
jgi:LuxR family transcriptional regulator, maltose regulon positive regulatory protein